MPDSHDYQHLESIYNSHTDSSNTFSDTSAASKLPPAANAVDTSEPNQRGRLIHRSPNGRVEIYERDFGGGHKVITRVIRVNHETPALDTANGGGHNHDDHDH